MEECAYYTQHSYRRDYWPNQPIRVGVWSEKGTVRGTLAPVLDAYQIPFLPTHGHNAATLTRDTAVRERGDHRKRVVLYVGDWDPSGLDMSERDLPDGLSRYGPDVEIIRLAIVADDLRTLPTFDCRANGEEARRKGARGKKGFDTRRPWFERNSGRICCELDALNSNKLRARVERAIIERIDIPAWNRMREIKAVRCQSLRDILSTWRQSLLRG